MHSPHATSRLRRPVTLAGLALAALAAACQSPDDSVAMRDAVVDVDLVVGSADTPSPPPGAMQAGAPSTTAPPAGTLADIFERRELRQMQDNGAYPAPDEFWRMMRDWGHEQGQPLPTEALRRAARKIALEREQSLAERLGVLRQAIEKHAWRNDGSFPSGEIVQELTTHDAGRPLLPFGFVGNPIRGAGPEPAAVLVVPRMPDACTGAGGWIYAVETGELRANSTGIGPSGVAYFDL